MPPSKTKKKQTRLAFASAATPTSPEQSSRYSTLTYDTPILGNSRPKMKTSVKRIAPPKSSETEQIPSKSNSTSMVAVPLRDEIPELTSTRQYLYTRLTGRPNLRETHCPRLSGEKATCATSQHQRDNQ
jgi:hypothetical protein